MPPPLGRRQVRQYNLSAPGDTAYLHEFLFGTERLSSAPVREILTDLQQGACFYGHRATKGQPEVDHFIPWAVCPMDLGHNFVLAHRECNAAKRDLLAAEEHLEGWVGRNREYGVALGMWAQRRSSLCGAQRVKEQAGVVL